MKLSIRDLIKISRVINPNPWGSPVEIELVCANSESLGHGKGEKVYKKWIEFNKKYGNIIQIGEPEEYETDDFYKEGSIFSTEEEITYFLNLLKQEGIKTDILHKDGEEIKL